MLQEKYQQMTMSMRQKDLINMQMHQALLRKQSEIEENFKVIKCLKMKKKKEKVDKNYAKKLFTPTTNFDDI